MATLLLNPRKRRAKSRKARSPAQRAATRRMIAANKSHAPRRSRRRRAVAVRANPVVHRRRRSMARRTRRNPISARRAFSSMRSSGAMSMLKTGAIAGVGAVAVDLLFAQVARFLPASMVTAGNADGSANYLYFAAKAATALGVGIFGAKVLPRSFAQAAAVGSLTIMAYQLARSMVPASLTLGRVGAYINPGRVVNPGRLNGTMSAYLPTTGAAGPGAMAANRGMAMARR